MIGLCSHGKFLEDSNFLSGGLVLWHSPNFLLQLEGVTSNAVPFSYLEAAGDHILAWVYAVLKCKHRQNSRPTIKADIAQQVALCSAVRGLNTSSLCDRLSDIINVFVHTASSITVISVCFTSCFRRYTNDYLTKKIGVEWICTPRLRLVTAYGKLACIIFCC